MDLLHKSALFIIFLLSIKGSVPSGDITWTVNNVNSTKMFNNSKSETNKNNKDSPLWMILMDQSQLVMTVVGLIGNIATSITLIKNGQVFSPVIRKHLMHQSLIDAAACLFAVLLLVQPVNWIPGVYILDTVICHVWQGNTPIGPQFGSQTYVEDGKCISDFLYTGPEAEKLYQLFAKSTFFTFWAVPVMCFIVLYGMVVINMQRRKRDSQFESNRVTDTAAKQLTKTAITVTAIFIIALGYDLWYYVLGYSGITEYKMNSPLQKLGMWFAAFNSVANPFVYALLMPTYRKSVINTFCPCVEENKRETTST